ncbi:hypothetical protein LTS08_002504 [Lithohypha guttulata]|nr:hypothetical protein LTS08_002504 [Lithohypha guttulata]
MGPRPQSIHINIDNPQYAPSPSVSEEDDGVEVSPEGISPDYSVIGLHGQTASQSSSSQHGDYQVIPPVLAYPSEVEQESEPDAHPYQHQIVHHPVHRSRKRPDPSRESSIQREPRRVVQLQSAHHPKRSRSHHHQHPESVADETDSTEAFLQQPDRPEYVYRMPRDQQYHGQAGYSHSSSSGSYSYPAVPHQSHQIVHYAPPGAPQPMLAYQHPQMPAPYAYPPQPQPHPQHQGPPPQPHPYGALVNTHLGHVTSPYSASPYGSPNVVQYQSPQSYFPPQGFPPYAQNPYFMQQMQQMQQFQGMYPPMPPHMHYTPPPRDSPQPAVASPAPAEPKSQIDEAAIMARFEQLLLAERADRDKKEDERQKSIQSAEDRAAAMAQADKDRREDERRIREQAIKDAEEEAARTRKLLLERAEEEKRIRQDALRAAEEEAVAARKREEARRLEEARIREEAKRDALEAEKKRIAAEAERKAYEAKIRQEAAEAALAAAAADQKAKKETADREAKIASDAAEAAKNAAEKQAKEIADAAEKAAKEAADAAEKEAKKAKEEHEAKLKEAEEAAAAAKKEAEAAEAKAAANAPPERKAPIRFKDALNRSYNFPWERCHKWDDMEGLIHQAFAHIDRIGPHVMQGRYDLIGPDKEIIMAEYWEDTVQPGMTITMMLWPIPEPEPEPEPMLPDPEPIPPPFDSDIIDLDALLGGTGPTVKKSKSKDKASAAKKRPGGFASWMLGANAAPRGRPALKGDKKPEAAAVYQHGAAEQGACIVM